MHEQTRSDRDQYINVNYSNINSNWTTNEDVREVYDVYVGFYSNSQFTTPLSLTTPLEIKIISNGVVSKVKIASGQSSVYLGQSLDEYSTEYGNYRYHNTISLGVVKGVGYILSY